MQGVGLELQTVIVVTSLEFLLEDQGRTIGVNPLEFRLWRVRAVRFDRLEGHINGWVRHKKLDAPDMARGTAVKL